MKEIYSVMTIKKIKSMGALQMAHAHNFRELPLVNTDPSLSYKNKELMNTQGFDYKSLWYKRTKEIEIVTGTPVWHRSNSVLCIEVVTTFSPEAEKNINIDEWAEANKKWLINTFGEDNVLSAVLHLDEGTPHMHSMIIPIDSRNRLCAKSFIGGRMAMFKLQDSYGKAMERFGLSRGEKFTRAKKQNLGKFYNSIEKAANATVPEPLPDESISDYQMRVNQYLQDKEMAYFKGITDLQRKLDVSESRFAQYRVHYREATNLQDQIYLSFDGNINNIKKRLRKYKTIEQSVPRKPLNNLLNNILTKFPPEDNLLYKEKKSIGNEYLSDDNGFEQ